MPYSVVAFSPAFSPDGRRLASASGDNCVKVWETATGQELLCLKGHTDRVFGVAFSPDGKQLASAGADGAVRIWDAVTGRELFCLRGHTGWIAGAAFSPDGRRLASAGLNDTVRIWDTGTGQEVLALKHGGPVMGVAFSQDGYRLASAGLDGTVKVWDATDLTPQRLAECEARGLVQWLYEESPLPALPVTAADTVGSLASPHGQGPLLAAFALLPKRPPLPQEVAAAVRRDRTITEPVRQHALDWLQSYLRIHDHAKRHAR
jgi:hypothetical protein